MEPTPRAAALWPGVREALRQIQASLSPNDFEPARADNSFVLAMADATAADLIPELLSTTEVQAPGISLRVVPLSTRDPRKLLDEQSIDLAVGYFPAVAADLTARAQVGKAVAFAYQRLYSGRYVCVMRRSHPLAQAPLTLDAYCAARHLLVSFTGKPFGFIDEALTLLQRKRRVVLTVNQFFTAGRVVAQSDLLTVLPHHFFHSTGFADELVLRELPFEVPTVYVDALWHAREDNNRAHQWLRQSVAQAAARAFTMAEQM